MKKICLNELSTVITIQAPAGVSDDMGGVTDQWVDAFQLWAKVVPGSGTEKHEADREESAVKYKFYVRFELDVVITNAMRLVFNDVQGVARRFNIRTVTDVDFKHEYTLIDAEEGVEV